MFRHIGGKFLCFSCRRPAFFRAQKRHFASQTSVPSVQPSSVSPLASFATALDKISPRFELEPSQIRILNSPSSFYATLKDKIRNAKSRIYLSTLYIGKTEFELIEALGDALRKNPDLKVSILTDALRGTRESPNPSGASFLASLFKEYGDRVEIRMYHTPNFRGLKRFYVPKRINEGWGLQHMKLYGIDDEVILSGANLSMDYFTNRLDRYHIFESKQLANYYARIHHAVCSLSFLVHPDPAECGYRMEWPESNGSPSPLEDAKAFMKHATSVLVPIIKPSHVPTQGANSSSTIVYPVAQFTPLLDPDESTEYPAITGILRALATVPSLINSSWTFTSGYFNMHPTVSSLLIASVPPAPANHNSNSSPPTTGTVLTASPWANGFYGSKGISSMLPAAYTHLSARFLDHVAAAGRVGAIDLAEWRRGTVGTPNGWTYHAKGLWVTLPREQEPSLTVIGSSNYTKRSYGLDLEAGAVVLTADEGLKRRLGEEMRWLGEDAAPVAREDLRRTERRVSWRVRLAMWIVQVVGGAL